MFFGGEPIPPTPPISSRSTRGSSRHISPFCLPVRSPPIHVSGPHSRPLISPAILAATGAARSGEFSRQPASKVSRIFRVFWSSCPPSESALSPPPQVIHTIRVHTYPGRPQTFFLLHVFSHYGVFFALLSLFFFGEKPKGKGRSLCLPISPFYNGPDISEALLHFVLTAGVLTSNGTLGRPLD